MSAYIWLAIAIIGDVAGTAALKACGGFTRIGPSVFALGSFGLVLISLCFTLKSLPLGLTYTLWSGLGTIATAGVGILLFKEPYDIPRIVGTCLIVVGMAVMYSSPNLK